MKKILKIIAIICIMIFSLTACGEKEKVEELPTNNSQVENKIENNIEENKVFNIENAFEEVEEVSILDEDTKMSNENIEKEFNFNEIEVEEKEIRSKQTENEISEIGIVKLKSNEQTEAAMKVFLERHAKLQEKYANNEEMLNIINNSENYILKQEGGYVIFILSEDAQKIESEMSKMTK